jgi:hypothetical protein
MDNKRDPEIYNIMCYVLILIGFYVLYKVFTLNEPDYDDDKSDHSN